MCKKEYFYDHHADTINIYKRPDTNTTKNVEKADNALMAVLKPAKRSHCVCVSTALCFFTLFMLLWFIICIHTIGCLKGLACDSIRAARGWFGGGFVYKRTFNGLSRCGSRKKNSRAAAKIAPMHSANKIVKCLCPAFWISVAGMNYISSGGWGGTMNSILSLSADSRRGKMHRKNREETGKVNMQ